MIAYLKFHPEHKHYFRTRTYMKLYQKSVEDNLYKTASDRVDVDTAQWIITPQSESGSDFLMERDDISLEVDEEQEPEIDSNEARKNRRDEDEEDDNDKGDEFDEDEDKDGEETGKSRYGTDQESEKDLKD